MLFNSFEFVLFFLVVWVLYYSPPFRKKQILLLLTASLAFYAWGAAQLTLVLLLCIGLNIAVSYLIDRSKSRQSALLLAWIGVFANLFILALFKYAGLLARTFLQLSQTSNTPVSGVISIMLHMPLPIGISFYTFEAISLLADTYKGKVQVRSLLEHAKQTALFVSFFPHLIAGPILRANQFFPQIKEKHFREINWPRAIHFLVVGYFFKMFVADNLQTATRWLVGLNFQGSSTLGSASSLVAFSAQIFADFAGYSFIAVGLGELLGYALPVNFKTPYIAQSLREFWQRWHITLSTWIRDYLYIPLGGGRQATWRICINLILVMTIAGLWHGASWGFALWGLYHGIGLCVERLWRTRQTAAEQNAEWTAEWNAWSILRVPVVFVFVTVGWVLFKISDPVNLCAFANSLVRGTGAPIEIDRVMVTIIFGFPVVAYHLIKCPLIAAKLAPLVSQENAPLARGIIYGIMLSLTILNAGPNDEFIYFQF